MKKTFKNAKGITLVALVITIIILLILAGISISALTNTGLFGKAKQAEQKSKNAQELENTTLGTYENEVDKYIYKTYKVGDAVKVGEEEFYVIADKGTTVELLAKYVLDEDAKKQTNEDIKCAFSTSNYWKDETIPSSMPFLNLNTYPAVQKDTESAVYKANSYAKSKGAISGRLLTHEEASSLIKSYYDIIFITYGKTNTYWLSSARSKNTVGVAIGKLRFHV